MPLALVAPPFAFSRAIFLAPIPERSEQSAIVRRSAIEKLGQQLTGYVCLLMVEIVDYATGAKTLDTRSALIVFQSPEPTIAENDPVFPTQAHHEQRRQI